MPKKRKSTTDAVIMIADIEDSSRFAEHNSHAAYNKMVREFHRIAAKEFDKYAEKNGMLKNSCSVELTAMRCSSSSNIGRVQNKRFVMPSTPPCCWM